MPKLKKILFLIPKVYSIVCIFSIYFLTQLSEGGLQFGHIAAIALCFLLSLPIVVWEWLHSKLLLRIVTITFIISLVTLNLLSKVVSNHVLQTTFYLGFIFIFFLAKYLSRGFRFSLQLFLLSAGSLTTYYGILNWKSAIAPGEERLWRSVPWHNPSAIMAAMFMFASIGLLLDLLKRKKHLSTLAPIYLLLALIFSLELYLSGSRGAALLSFLGIVFLIVYKFRESKKILSILLLLPILLIPAVSFANNHAGKYDANGEIYMGSANPLNGSVSSGLLSRSASAAGNMEERVRYWKSALKMFQDSPIVGQGLGSWESIIWKFRANDEDLSTATHNDFLQALAEGGLLLLAPFTFFILLIMFSALKSTRGKDNRIGYEEVLTLSLLIGCMVFLLHSNMDFNSRYFQTWFTFGLFMGWLVSRSEITLSQEESNDLETYSLLEDGEESTNKLEDEGIVAVISPEIKEERKWYKLEKSRKSPVIIPLMMILLFTAPSLLLINQISTNGKALDDYHNYSAKGVKVPMLDPTTAFDSTIVLHNAYELSTKKLYNLAILELQLGQKYNPGDSRLKLYELLIARVSGKDTIDFKPYLFTKDGHYWTTGYLNVLWMYSMVQDKDNFYQYLEKLEKLNSQHLGWEYFSNQGWYYINSLLYEARFGDGCQGAKANAIRVKAEDFFKSAPRDVYLREVNSYNATCKTNFTIE